MVEPQKIIKFLTEKIFTCRRILVVNLEAGYKGVIGLLRHDPKVFPDQAREEEREVMASFRPELNQGG